MFALIFNNRVVDISETQFEVADGFSWEQAPEGCELGWLYENGQFNNPFEKTQAEIDAEKLAYLRNERNKHLKLSDWTQVADVSLSDTKKKEWQTYRQALRDITQSFQSMDDDGFAWPVEPTA